MHIKCSLQNVRCILCEYQIEKISYCEARKGYILLGGLTANIARSVCMRMCCTRTQTNTHKERHSDVRAQLVRRCSTNRIRHAELFIILCVWFDQSSTCTTRSRNKNTTPCSLGMSVSMSKPEQQMKGEKAARILA